MLTDGAGHSLISGAGIPLENAAIVSSSLTWSFPELPSLWHASDTGSWWGTWPCGLSYINGFSGPGRFCSIQPTQEGPGMPIHNFEFYRAGSFPLKQNISEITPLVRSRRKYLREESMKVTGNLRMSVFPVACGIQGHLVSEHHLQKKSL